MTLVLLFIFQCESWYFGLCYRSTEGGRLSRRMHYSNNGSSPCCVSQWLP